MKIFTLFELQQFEAYPMLKNVLNDAEIQFFFNTPEAQRGALLSNKTIKRVEPKLPHTETVVIERGGKKESWKITQTAPPKTMKIPSTQMCPTVDIDSIRDMALDYMGRDFVYNGKTYNLNEYGWRFRFGNTKRALGRCMYRTYAKKGVIELSQWVIENSKEDYDKWVNTMLHEIAHAIDVIIRGDSSHDWRWQSVALAIGCDGKRTTQVEFDDLLKNPISKYTIVCPNGHTKPSHKIKHTRSSCRRCNDAIGGKGFNEDFLLKQIRNW